MINYELALLIAVSAFVYSSILTEADMLFCWLYKRLDRFFKTDKRKLEGKGYHPLFMILIHCSKCVAGQWSFWLYLYIHLNLYLKDPAMYFFHHVFFVSVTIFMTEIIRIFYRIIHKQTQNDE